ncbi:MAG TPA: integration host factor subunit alpha [Candidatus Binataceae bacterium]|nr:integration host factor subunit alpha [Candidatus Binataceae bacterium]
MGDEAAQNMTKADLVDLIYERIGSSKKEACEIVEEVFRIIEDCLQRGEKVKISGFGSFVVNHKRARRGRNPQTGSAIIIDSRRVLSFKPSQVLKSLVANGTKRSA